MPRILSFRGTQGEFSSHLSRIQLHYDRKQIITQESHRVCSYPLSRPHEKAVKITHCSLRWLSHHKELIDRTLPKLQGDLFWSRTYGHIDYCVYDSQGLEDTNAQCLTFWSSWTQRLWHGLVAWADTMVRLPLSHNCHIRQTDGFVCSVYHWELWGVPVICSFSET